MILHLGQETVIKEEDVIGIFDLDSTTVSKKTRSFLTTKQKEGKIVPVSEELPKSFILAGKKNTREEIVYLSQLSTATLYKRTGMIEFI